ncbi:MAG: site-specific DNA-methyltransferase [Candidatus Andersenbacteria bacterium]
MPILHFKGKPVIQNHHHTVKFHELLPDKKKSLSDEPSLDDNLIVHGDNLKALKALLPTYAGKVKCIYIDPPYNTGNEGWAYNDNVNSPMIQKWLKEEVGRDDLARHDKWCCMMYPRLKLLRELLSDEGVIFVSIDDNEAHNLRSMMEEIFGEDRYVATIIWRSADSSNNDAKQFSLDHNETIVFSKNPGWKTNLLDRTDEDNAHYTNPDDDPRGAWFPGNLSSPNPRENLKYKITSPQGHEISSPANGWRWSEEVLLEKIEEREVIFSEDGKRLIKKTYLVDQKGLAPSTLWADIEETGHNRNAKYELKKIFPEKETADLFKTPKPTKFIKKILDVATSKNDIVLDSFAGSGTTAHAVLAQNKEDGGNRKFILVEMEDYADKITAERVRRVIKGIPEAKDGNLKEGFGGSFSFYKLGDPVDVDDILEGKKLPSYEDLAQYTFYTATGEVFKPKALDKSKYYLGKSATYQVFMMYEPDADKLREMALNLDFAEEIEKQFPEEAKLVFAPACFLEEFDLRDRNIRFAQLPFEIYRLAE